MKGIGCRGLGPTKPWPHPFSSRSLQMVQGRHQQQLPLGPSWIVLWKTSGPRTTAVSNS